MNCCPNLRGLGLLAFLKYKCHSVKNSLKCMCNKNFTKNRMEWGKVKTMVSLFFAVLTLLTVLKMQKKMRVNV